MSNSSDIVIYEKDSVNVSFKLDASNSAITTFSADDKIILAIKYGRSDHALILKEQTGITGDTVTFSLTKQDTFCLHPQKYVYDISVLVGESQQTTVLKSAYFIVSDRAMPKPKSSVTITLDTLQEYNLLVQKVQGYADSASNSADNASESASGAEALLSMVADSANSAINTLEQAQSYFSSLASKIEAINNTAKAAIEAQNNIGEYVDKVENNAITATESSNAAHRYANEIYALLQDLDVDRINQAVEELEEIKTVVESIVDDLKSGLTSKQDKLSEQQINNLNEDHSAYAKNKEVQEMIQAEATARSNADSSFNIMLSNEVTNRTNADNNLQEQIDNINTVKQDVINDLDTIRNNASIGAGLTSQVSSNTSKIAANTNNISANAETINKKANSADVYIKSDIDSKVSSINNSIGNLAEDVAKKANSADVYIKSDIDSKVSSINNSIGNKLNTSTYQTDLQGLKFGTTVVNGTTVLQVTVP